MSLTKVSYAMTNGAPLNVLDYGAKGDGVTDDTAAIQAALTAANASNKRVYVPEGVYIITSTLTVTNAAEGLYIYGDTTSNFNTPFVSNAKTGSVLSFTGSGVLLQINGSASNVHALIQNISFAGNNNAVSGIKLNAGWFLTLEHCVFNNFKAVGAAALHITYTTGSFVGVTKITNCEFSDNVTHVYFDKPDTNVLVIDKCSFYTHTYAVLAGNGVTSVSSRNVNITNCIFESVDADYDIYCYGGGQGWNIINNYFEQNDNTVNSPRIGFGGGVLYPLNQSITITGNVFSKELGGAGGDALVYISQGNGVIVKNNWTAFPISGSVANKYSVLGLSLTNYDIDPFNAVSGASPYPVNVNSSTVYAGFSDYTGTKLVGGNMKFPATPIASTDPNVLDDYEEGTWTPINNYVTLTVNQTSIYRKIGSLVYASFDVTFPASANTNLAEILGLPFNVGSGMTEAVSVTFSDYGSLVYMYTVLAGGANIYDATGAALQNTQVAGKRFAGYFMYTV